MNDLSEILSRNSVLLEDSIRIGKATAEWIDTEEGVSIHVSGGSLADRQTAWQSAKIQLEANGYNLIEYKLAKIEDYENL